MKKIITIIVGSFFLISLTAAATVIDINKAILTAVDVSYSLEQLNGVNTVKVIKNPQVKAVDEPTFVRLPGNYFKDGTIEVKVLSRLLSDAPDFARGFIGIAFRINDDNSAFESIYIRPTNGRTDDLKRRQNATQYFSYPAFKFDRLRKESPGKYESPADIGLNEWVQLKITVKENTAKLFINNSTDPALEVNDLKHPSTHGAIGLWVDIGTEGYFSEIHINHQF
jgi:hypothetical protein